MFDLDDAFKRYNRKQGDYPKFKGKYTAKRSYRTNYISNVYKGRKYENIKIDLKKRVISLPKLGEVKIRGYRNLQSLEARIISATVSQLANGKYYVSIAVEEKHPVVKIIPKK